VYILPDACDFHSLCKIEPHVVHSLGGASITAVGIGDIHLYVGRDTHVTLHNTLFILAATVKLISV
jgi:hypothetical protein